MRDELKEQLSALADDELRPDELPLLLRQLERSPQMMDQLGRYVLIRDALHRNLATAGRTPLGARVAEALASEPTPVTGLGEKRVRALLRPVAGMTIAASVALVALLLWPQTETTVPGGDTASVAEVQQPTSEINGAQFVATSKSETPATTPVTQLQWDRLDPQAQQRLNGFLVDHSELSSIGQLGGVLPDGRIAGHERAE